MVLHGIWWVFCVLRGDGTLRNLGLDLCLGVITSTVEVLFVWLDGSSFSRTLQKLPDEFQPNVVQIWG